MKSVGIKNLKDNLTEYLKLVKRGEVVYVTDKNEIIAEIKKPDSETEESASAKFEKFLNEQAQSGNLRPAKRNKSTLKKSSIKRRIKQSDWWNSYEKTRSDRF